MNHASALLSLLILDCTRTRFTARMIEGAKPSDMRGFHGGPTMFARIGIMQALNRHVERPFDTSGKKTHWGKRKLARDR
jgi:hypothetical protein